MRERAMSRGAWLVGLVLGPGAPSCFTGDGLVDQPCTRDEDCNPRSDVLGERLRCTYNVQRLWVRGTLRRRPSRTRPSGACWGSNDEGELGVNHTNNVGDDPMEMPPA